MNPEPREGARTVLIIEDDPTFASVLAGVAERRGVRAHVAARGDTGLAMARQLCPDGVILDVRMPGIDGWSLLDRLKHTPATAAIPVCVVSGDERRDRGLRLGAFTYLQKPISEESLGSALDRMDAFVARSPKRVLVLDDDASRRAELTQLLTLDGVHVASAANAVDASRELAAGPFDAVVLAAEGGADEALRQLAAHAGIVDRPFLLLAPGGLSATARSRLRRAASGAALIEVRSLGQMLDEAVRALHLAESRMPDATRAMLQEARRAHSTLAGRKVLVVDDDARSVFALSSALERHGVNIVAATGGQQALELLKTTSDIEVVLLDMMMPDIDGYETTRRIRTMPQWREVPIVALTAKAMKGDREQCLTAGASDYLAKPIDLDQLFAILRVALTA